MTTGAIALRDRAITILSNTNNMNKSASKKVFHLPPLPCGSSQTTTTPRDPPLNGSPDAVAFARSPTDPFLNANKAEVDVSLPRPLRSLSPTTTINPSSARAKQSPRLAALYSSSEGLVRPLALEPLGTSHIQVATASSSIPEICVSSGQNLVGSGPLAVMRAVGTEERAEGGRAGHWRTHLSEKRALQLLYYNVLRGVLRRFEIGVHRKRAERQRCAIADLRRANESPRPTPSPSPTMNRNTSMRKIR